MTGYLALLDSLLELGAAALSEAFTAAQLAWIAARQSADGGFPGRRGGSDLYYTDFAVRVLALLDPAHPILPRAATYLAGVGEPRTLIDACNGLQIARLLRQCGHVVEAPRCAGVLDRFHLPTGGYHGGDGVVSGYATFLAALCREMLGLSLDPADAAAVSSLRTPDGGFSETAGIPVGQANATTAALAVQALEEQLDDAEPALAFLAGLQGPDGGIRAHAVAPHGDLLSTFTTLTTLALLDTPDRLDLSAFARFLRATATSAGGFRACPEDAEGDIEYTYYGLASLCLLRAWVMR